MFSFVSVVLGRSFASGRGVKMEVWGGLSLLVFRFGVYLGSGATEP